MRVELAGELKLFNDFDGKRMIGKKLLFDIFFQSEVNGPGEAKEADIGIAGGIGEGLLIKHGEIYKKVKEEELLPALRYELLHWSE